MHEYHAVESLVKQIIEKALLAKAEKVERVTIVMGELLRFDESSVKLYFEEIARGTIAEKAQLVFKTVKASFKCKGCNKEFAFNKETLSCPYCCSMQSAITTGKELYIDSIEVI